ncbi:MAG: ComEC/Rec2 family competence protein [Phycisphaerae bacterium]|nr:ComEC/Rec2 family competence protein [Phycisphaerae bacterium]
MGHDRTIPFREMSAPARAPLVPAAIGLVAGIVADAWLAPPAWAYGLTLLAAAAIVLAGIRHGVRWPVVCVLLALGLGGLLHHRSFRRLPPDHIYHFTQETPTIARVRGTVLTEPRVYQRALPIFERWTAESWRTSFFIEAGAADTLAGFRPASGVVRVTVKEPVREIRVGQHVELFGQLYRPPTPDNPGQFNWSLRDRRNGVWVGMSCGRRECIQVLSNERPDRLYSAWARVRTYVRGLLLGDMLHHAGRESSLLDALVLGRRGDIDRDLNEAFIRSGCAHFLAVSGMHVCMLGGFVWLLGRVVGLRLRAAAVLVIAVTLVYAALVEPRPPVLRAALMTVVYCGAIVLYRRRQTTNALALALLILLIRRPASLFDPGLQLSFTAVLGIVYLFHPLHLALMRLHRCVRPPPSEDPLDRLLQPTPSRLRLAARHAGRWIGQALAVTFAAWLAGLPLAMLYFQRLSLWGWLNTLLVGPVVLVVMVASFLKVLLGLLPGLAGPLTPMVEWPAAVLSHWVDALSRLPGASLFTPSPPISLLIWYYALLALWVIAVRRPAWYGRLLHMAGAAWDRRAAAPEPAVPADVTTITVMPAGAGCVAVVELAGGAVLLFDASGPAYDPRGLGVLAALLRRRGIRYVNLLIASHPHRDARQFAPDCLDNLDVGGVCVTPWLERLAARDGSGTEWVRRLKQRGYPVHVVSAESPSVGLGNTRLDFLWPPASPPFALGVANASLVLRVAHRDRAVLLCGDIREDAQEWMAHQTDVRADVAVLPHFRTLTQATPRLLAEAEIADLVCPRPEASGGPDPVSELAPHHRIHSPDARAGVEVSMDGAAPHVRAVDLPSPAGPSRIGAVPFAAVAAALVISAIVWLWPAGHRDALTFTVLSVGRGTSSVLELPDGQTWLYDAGAGGSYDPGHAAIVPYLRYRRTHTVDGVFLSHPNLDHFNGLLTVADQVRVRGIRVTPCFESLCRPGTPGQVLLAELARRRLNLTAVSADDPPLRFEDVTIEVLWPPRKLPFEVDANDSSLVLRVRYAGRSILLTGDVEYAAQQWLIDHADLRADVLLLPHHGSVCSNTGAFIQAVDPAVVIRSSFERRERTSEELLHLLSDRTCFSTADHGAVTVRITPAALTVTTQRCPAARLPE